MFYLCYCKFMLTAIFGPCLFSILPLAQNTKNKKCNNKTTVLKHTSHSWKDSLYLQANLNHKQYLCNLTHSDTTLLLCHLLFSSSDCLVMSIHSFRTVALPQAQHALCTCLHAKTTVQYHSKTDVLELVHISVASWSTSLLMGGWKCEFWVSATAIPVQGCSVVAPFCTFHPLSCRSKQLFSHNLHQPQTGARTRQIELRQCGSLWQLIKMADGRI